MNRSLINKKRTSLWPQSGSINVPQNDNTNRSNIIHAKRVSRNACDHNAITVWYHWPGDIISPGINAKKSTVISPPNWIRYNNMINPENDCTIGDNCDNNMIKCEKI